MTHACKYPSDNQEYQVLHNNALIKAGSYLKTAL